MMQANKVEEDNRETTSKVSAQNVTEEDTRQNWQLLAEHAQQNQEGGLCAATELEQDNWLAKAANLAIRAAVGGDDMLLKCQLMAEHALQTHEEKLRRDGQAAKDASETYLSTSMKRSEENWEPKSTSSFSACTVPNFTRSSPLQRKRVRTLIARDVIADLERNPQTSRSTLIHRFYEGMHASAVESK